MSNDHHHLEDFFGLKPDSNGSQPPTKEPLRNTVKKGPGLWERLRLLPKVLSVRERYIIGALLLVIAGSLISFPFTIYRHYTDTIPAQGGMFIEGLIGQPRRINPLLAQTNDTDRDLSSLIYSSLLKYNDEGKLVPDLAKSYEISADQLNYTIYLKPNAFWHDGQAVTIDDIVYTIQTAQNADYGSPLRVNWQGVEVKKVDSTTVILKLKTKYAQFLNSLTISILPAHIWSNIQPINFSVSDYNLKPIGSGPYMFKKLQKDAAGRIQTYELAASENYYDGRALIDTITMRFYDNENQLITAYNNNEIENLVYISPGNLKKLKFLNRLNIQEIELPRYFGVFFNQGQSKALGDKNTRIALNHATDKESIIKEILNGKGTSIYSPLIENVLDVSQDITKYQYDINHAKEILAASGWQAGPDGILKKNNTILSIRLTTPTFPELVSVATMLKEQWSKIGVSVVVDTLSSAQLQQAIKERSYEALLFGEILNPDPDPFSLWHSSQINDPGLNLALYQNKTADGLLEDARQLANPSERVSKYNDFQKLVIADAPAIFLYNPLYLYPQTKEIHGFNGSTISTPSDRFSNVENWYINTSRTLK